MSTLHFSPPVIAHRGACAYAPENTLSAFLKAYELGIHWVEFDVMLAACGEVVVIHDETLERTTNGKGSVIGYPYDFLQTLDAGSWFSPHFAHEKIPTLIQVLQFLKAHQMSANIEIKAQAGVEKVTVEKVLNVLKQYGQHCHSLLSSFSLPTVEYLRELSPDSWIGFLMDEWRDDWQTYCDQWNCVSVHVNHQCLDSSRIQQIKSTDRWVLSYTVNDAIEAHRLFKWGVDAVYSDYPDKILKV